MEKKVKWTRYIFTAYGVILKHLEVDKTTCLGFAALGIVSLFTEYFSCKSRVLSAGSLPDYLARVCGVFGSRRPRSIGRRGFHAGR
jgi:hypothetical protein